VKEVVAAAALTALHGPANGALLSIENHIIICEQL
jgi:hypothetical protein